MLRFFVGFCLVLERKLLFLGWLQKEKERRPFFEIEERLSLSFDLTNEVLPSIRLSFALRFGCAIRFDPVDRAVCLKMAAGRIRWSNY